jgi:PIN domain nuclease of toxin-antitoxin system
MMKILLDTHTFLWWILDDPKLSTRAVELIGDNRNTLYWSAASSWEVSIKYALGRLPLPETPEQFLPVELGKNRIESLPIIDAHAFQAGRLPHHHGDPFDRMLVAQAQVEFSGLISNDKQLSLYDIDVHW